MPFPCSNCGGETNTIISRPDVPHFFCSNCRPENVSRDRKGYTGRKMWAGSEVYSREQLREKAHNFEESQRARVKEERRRMRPSLRAKLYGE